MTTTRITSPQNLTILRLLWMTAAGIAALMFFASLPAEYAFFRDAPTWGLGFESALRQMGLSRDFLAAYTTAIDLIVVVPAVLLAVTVFRKRPDDWMALLVSMTMLLYAVSLTLAFYLSAPAIAEAIRFFIPALVLWVALTFPDGRFIPAWSKWVLPVLVFVDICLLVFLNSPFLLGYFGYLVAMIALLLRYRSAKQTPEQRQQVRWALWGLIVAFLAVAVYTLIPLIFPHLRSLDWDTPVYTVESLVVFLVTNTIRLSSSLIFVAAIGLSILRYRLWDLDLTINRSLVYGMVTLLLGAVFLLGVALIRAVFGQEQSSLALAASLAGAGALFNPLRRRIQHVIDRRFYGFRYDLNELADAQKTPEIKNPGRLSGRKIGVYQVLDMPGKGGMGEVYKAQGDGRTVALKILPEDLALQDEFRKRFERETEALAVLQHPNIVRSFGSGSSEGITYLAMEFIDGEDLGKRLKISGRIAFDELYPMLEDVASALDYAHQQGFVHRDIKPSNIMVRNPTPDPSPNSGRGEKPDYRQAASDVRMQAVLMDFGIAKVQQAQTGLTGTGAIGTIDYMAPEQIMAAKDVGPEADIYALGVVVYEALTGQRPFSGNVGQVVFAHLQQPAPDPRDIVPELSFEISDAILKALDKDPAQRFRSAGEFVAALI